MDPNSREPREITYRIGWKRGRMVANAPFAAAGNRGEKGLASQPLSAWERFNRNVAWKAVPMWQGRFILAAAGVLPAVLFGMFLWMVYVLASLG